MKPWYQSKIVWVNLIVALIAIVGQFAAVIPAQYQDEALAFVAILNVLLRLITGQPIGKQ